MDPGPLSHVHIMTAVQSPCCSIVPAPKASSQALFSLLCHQHSHFLPSSLSPLTPFIQFFHLSTPSQFIYTLRHHYTTKFKSRPASQGLTFSDAMHILLTILTPLCLRLWTFFSYTAQVSLPYSFPLLIPALYRNPLVRRSFLSCQSVRHPPQIIAPI